MCTIYINPKPERINARIFGTLSELVLSLFKCDSLARFCGEYQRRSEYPQ